MSRLSSVFLSFLFIAASAIAGPVPLLFRVTPEVGTDTVSHVSISFPFATNSADGAEVYLTAPPATPWHHGETLQGKLILPDGEPGAELLAFLKDRDGHWFQALLPNRLAPGTNHWSLPFSAEAKGAWRPVGHHLVWNHRTRMNPLFVGLRVFRKGNARPPTGECTFLETSLALSPAATTPPAVSSFRLSTEAPACFSMVEGSFRLPDRYDNPFDPEEIDVRAEISAPDGKNVTTPAFYMQDFYAEKGATGMRLSPDGAPGWRLRYAPRLPGAHTVRILATDSCGSVTSAPLSFVATASDGPGYVTVSKIDRRRFAVGTNLFFPIGHNIRSPFDTRYDAQYPWRARLPEDYTVYERYFKRMGAAGENMAEVWMCQWSLGLEWSSVSPGYHGAGDYHLGNAWELDRVLDFARANGIRLNLVLNNHGRVSLFSDEEWDGHPYNEKRGGFLPADDPMLFFSDRRAIDLQKRLCRYIVARWGWSPSIFAFELWSELDLCGGGKRKTRSLMTPEVTDWHREIAGYLKSIDPNKHLIATHISNNYRNAFPAVDLLSLPELDHCCIDAYHGHPSPLFIAELVEKTGEFYEQFKKPVLITEFGGSALGAGVGHISAELHAALWSAACSPLGGAPFLWWWGLIDEQDLYPEFTALKNFLAGSDLRDPSLRPIVVDLGEPKDDDQEEDVALLQSSLGSGDRLCSWICHPWRLSSSYYGNLPTNAPPLVPLLAWEPASNGVYRVVQYDTRTGTPVKIHDLRPENGQIRFRLTPFPVDCAIKIFPRPELPVD